MAAQLPSVSLGGKALHAGEADRKDGDKPESAAAFVARLTANPVQKEVTAAANTLRLRLVRALELLQSTTLLLDGAAVAAISRSKETQAVRDEMEELKQSHKESLKKAHSDRSTAVELEKQAANVCPTQLGFCALSNHSQFEALIQRSHPHATRSFPNKSLLLSTGFQKKMSSYHNR